MLFLAEVRAEQHRLVWGRAMPALSELLQVGRDADKDKVFSKLVTLCVLLSGLGSPRSDVVVKETYRKSINEKTSFLGGREGVGGGGVEKGIPRGS